MDSNEQKREDFINLVYDMRDMQRQYFATRTPSILTRAKALERQVDDVILKYRLEKAAKR